MQEHNAHHAVRGTVGPRHGRRRWAPP